MLSETQIKEFATTCAFSVLYELKGWRYDHEEYERLWQLIANAIMTGMPSGATELEP